MYTSYCVYSLVFSALCWSRFHATALISSAWTETGHVLTLNNRNFQSEVKHHDVLLILFYVQWCSFCRRVHPEYEQAGAQLAKETNDSILLAKFDCTQEREAQCSRRFSIDGYPALRIYRYGRFRGEELNYQNRTAAEIVKTMKILKGTALRDPGIPYASDQTHGVKDEPNLATKARPFIWYLMGWMVLLCSYW